MNFLILLGLLVFSVLKSNGQRCTDLPFTDIKFSQLDTPYTGCNDSSPGFIKRSRIDCSIFCLNYKNCVAFSFNKTTRVCRVCIVTSKVALFDTGQTPSTKFYAVTQGIKVTEAPAGSTLNLVVDTPCGITLGNMMVLKAKLLDFAGFKFNLKQDPDNIALHFRQRTDSSGAPFLSINTMVNGVFISQYLPTFKTYPFKVSQVFELRILARSDDYAIFINGNYAFNYSYAFNPINTRYMEVLDKLDFIELSV